MRSGTSTGSNALRASLLIMGASGIITQIVLMRELMVTFLGNELVLGIILANWLILEAAGSFLIGRAFRSRGRELQSFVLIQLIFSLALPPAIYFSRVFKTLVLRAPGEAVGFVSILAVSFLILLPVAVPHGALFTFGSKLYSAGAAKANSPRASSIGRVYVLETAGSILGGFLLTFILIRHFHSLHIAFAVSLLNALISLILLWPKSPDRSDFLHRSLWAVSLLLTLCFALLLFSPLCDRIHLASIRTQWQGQEVVLNENSIYGNITVTGRENQMTFYTDGVPVVTTPVPDIATIEDMVHFPMLLHPQPESVLILSGGAGGMIREVLKHPVQRIDYVELDPLLLEVITRYGSPMTQRELSDGRVRVHLRDGRFFLTHSQDSYDVLFIGLGAPQDLQTNRLFSREFFTMAKEKLKPQGLIALTLPGSLTYLGEELRNLNGCLRDTLESVFTFTRIIPGDVNLYIASDSPALMKVNSSQLASRLEERRIQANLMTPPYIEYRLQQQWLQGFHRALEKLPQRINSDFRPLAVFYGLSYWNALFSPYFQEIFQFFERIRMYTIAALIAAATLVAGAAVFLRRSRNRVALPYAIATTGFCGMILDLAIIFTFQVLFGYLYYQIGLLVTVFMAGAALGSFCMVRRLDRMTKVLPIFMISELCLVIFCLLLPFAFMISTARSLLYTLFLSMSFISGVLTGVQFPLASRLHLAPGTVGEPPRAAAGAADRAMAHTAGMLYGADLLGGYFGGLIGGVILLPILGLKNTCFILGMIKASSLLLNMLGSILNVRRFEQP